MNVYGFLVFLAAAVLEVGGDALVRHGVKGGGRWFILAGFVALGTYGLVVNTERNVDFSRLLGVYAASFALVSVLVGRFVFREHVSVTTWLGLVIIIIGGIIIQIGQQ